MTTKPGQAADMTAATADQPQGSSAAAAVLRRLTTDSSLLDDVADAVVVLDLQWTILRWNEGATALYGWAAAEAVGQSFPALVPTLRYLTGGPREAAIAALFGAGRWRGTVGQRHRDGQEVVADVSLRMLYDAERQPVGVTAINRDIGERQRLLAAEQAARAEAEAARSRLQVIASASRAFAEAQLTLPAVLQTIVSEIAHLIRDNCVLRLLSADGTELLPGFGSHWNPEARWTVEQVLARHPRPSSEGIMGRAITSGEPVLIPQVPPGLISASGIAAVAAFFAKFPIHSVLAVPLRVHDRTIGALALAREQTPTPFTADDLTLVVEIAERAAMAIENARLYEDAQAAVKVRETFLSIAAHELRTPLTSLLGHVTRMRRRADRISGLGERDRISLDTIAAQGRRLNQLIEELLDVTRLQQGVLVLQRESIDLGALTQKIVADVASGLQRHQLSCETPSEPLLVDADPLRLEQVLLNLLQNAVKYSPHGGAIQVRLQRQAQQASLTVADSGIGIPSADLPRLFQQFYRASNVDPRQLSGLGIGLYLSRVIMERHGGTITVESRQDIGSTFTVLLPLVQEPAT